MTEKVVRSRNRIVWLVVAVALAVPAALVTAAAVALVWASSTVERLGEPVPESIARTVTLPGRGAAGGAEGPPAHLDIDLEDGVFEVRPGPTGSEVRVEGTYASKYYNLIQDHAPSGSRPGRTVMVRLERARSFLVQLMAHAMERTPSTPNELTVTIPRDTPLSVDLTIRAGESRVDLGGLSLTDLTVDLAMGDHRLDFSEPLAVAPRRVRLDGGMGEIRFERLGNARAEEIEASGHMGSVTVDLGGSWPADTMANVTLNNLMGELRLRAPAGLRLVGDAEGWPDPDADGRASRPGEADPGGPALRLRTSTTMGETRLIRY